MKTVIGLVTLPLWLPMLLTVASASLVLGMVMVSGGILLKQHRDEPEPWDLA